MSDLTSESPTQLWKDPEPGVEKLPVVILPSGVTLLRAARYQGSNTRTFAHVLNVPETEVIWPGEAIDLFLLTPTFFAVSPYTGEFIQGDMISEHMRCETLRLCSAELSSLDHMEEQLALYCEFNGPFPFDFGDRCEDEGELLLEYPEDF